VLHVLNEREADLPHLDASQNLRHLRLLDAIAPLLQIVKRLLQGFLFKLGVLEFGLGDAIQVLG